VREFYFGHQDSYRLIVNLDYGSPLVPAKQSLRSEPADFQRGGFSFEESQIVAGWPDAAGVDLIEISGGTYEQPKMANINGVEPVFDPFTSKSTREREAFFARFAPEMRRHVKRAKLMVTGGFRTAQGMADAIVNDGVDLIAELRHPVHNLMRHQHIQSVRKAIHRLSRV